MESVEAERDESVETLVRSICLTNWPLFLSTHWYSGHTPTISTCVVLHHATHKREKLTGLVCQWPHFIPHSDRPFYVFSFFLVLCKLCVFKTKKWSLSKKDPRVIIDTKSQKRNGINSPNHFRNDLCPLFKRKKQRSFRCVNVWPATARKREFVLSYAFSFCFKTENSSKEAEIEVTSSRTCVHNIRDIVLISWDGKNV